MDFANLRRAWMLGDCRLLGDGMYLGAYTGRYLLFERRSKDSLREPSFSVLAEEFGDISDSVTEAEYWRRQEDSLGEPNYGEGTIAIFDEEGEYVENGSPLFRVGKRVYIFAGFNDDNIPRFGGIIRNIFVDSTARNIQLSVSEEGYRLRTAKTSGDYSSYSTPKLMINQIATEANIADPIYENETGQPTNFQFGYTDLRLRSHWSIIHGSAFCIGYKQIFTEVGRLKLRRSTTFEDLCYPGVKRCWRLGDGYTLGDGRYLGEIYASKTRPYAYGDAYVFDDTNIQWIVQRRRATLINKKTIDYMQCVRPEFTAGDGVRAGQHTRAATDSLSKKKYGEHEDQETDELVGSWSNAGKINEQVLDEYPYPRGIYDMRTKAMPQVQIDDRVFVNSEARNISGWFKILGIESESIRPGGYDVVYNLLSEGERF